MSVVRYRPSQLLYCKGCGHLSTSPFPNIDFQWVEDEHTHYGFQHYVRQCLHCMDTHMVIWMPSWAVLDIRGQFTPIKQNGTQRFVSDASTVFKMCVTIGKATSAIRCYSCSDGLYFVDVGPRHLPVLQKVEGNRLPCAT